MGTTTLAGVIWLAYGVWGGWICWIDATTRRLPNTLTWPAFIATAIFTVVLPHWQPQQLLGGLLWAMFIVFAPLVSRRMQAGGGDAKLALTLGTLATGEEFWGLWVAMAVAGLVGVGIAKATTVRDRDSFTPHGPAMVVGTLVVVVGFIVSGA